MNKVIPIFVLIVLIISSCHIADKKGTTTPSFVVDIRDTINRQISANYIKSVFEPMEKNKKDFFSRWPIYSLEKGVDSFEIRLSFEGILISPGPDFYTIKKVDTAMYGKRVCSLTRSGDSIVMVKFVPKCGWKLFMDSLMYFGIYSFPSQTEIKNFKDGINDGESAVLEYATNRLYRRISYHEPEHFGDSTNRKFWAFLLMWNRNIPTWGISYFKSDLSCK